MFLFILESIGTSELILVGIAALIFLGPRKLPEMAKKAGKIMAEFRGTANEFKETWEREVNFDEEAKSLSLSSLDDVSVARGDSGQSPETTTIPDEPTIKAVDPETLKHLVPIDGNEEKLEASKTELAVSDKKNWL